MNKLNLGCGTDIRLGYINIDLIPQNSKVIAANVLDLDKYVKPKSCDEVVANFIIEYLTPQQLPVLIDKIKQSLCEDGIVTIMSLDYSLLAGKIAHNNIDLISINNHIYSNNKCGLYNLVNVKSLLINAGLKPIVSSYDDAQLTFTITAKL